MIWTSNCNSLPLGFSRQGGDMIQGVALYLLTEPFSALVDDVSEAIFNKDGDV